MPVPSFSVISGGKYAGNKLTCQEFAILPIGTFNNQALLFIFTLFYLFLVCIRIFDAGAESFADAVKMGTEVYRVAERKIVEAQGITGPPPVSDKGAFVPEMEDDKDALTLLNDSIKDAGYEGKIKIALDMAASAFYKEGRFKVENSLYTSERLLDFE